MKKWVQLGVEKSEVQSRNRNNDLLQPKKSRFTHSKSKSRQSSESKALKLGFNQSPSKIHDLSHEDATFQQKNIENDQIQMIRAQKAQSVQQKKDHGKSRVSSIASEIPKNTNSKSYLKTINSLKQQFEKFKEEIKLKLFEVEEYYNNAIQNLTKVYETQIAKLGGDRTSFPSFKLKSTNHSLSSITSNHEIKFTQKLSSNSLLPPSPKVDSVIFSRNSSLSQIAGTIKEDQFKRFAQILEKIKTDMNEEIQIPLENKRKGQAVSVS